MELAHSIPGRNPTWENKIKILHICMVLDSAGRVLISCVCIHVVLPLNSWLFICVLVGVFFTHRMINCLHILGQGQYSFKSAQKTLIINVHVCSLGVPIYRIMSQLLDVFFSSKLCQKMMVH